MPRPNPTHCQRCYQRLDLFQHRIQLAQARLRRLEGMIGDLHKAFPIATLEELVGYVRETRRRLSLTGEVRS